MKFLSKILFTVLIIFSLCIPRAALAEEPQSTESRVTVLPAKFDLWATRGQTLEQSLQIINDDDHDYIYALSTENISSTGENGEVEIGGSNPNLSNLLSSWILTDQINGRLEAKKTKVINFKIKIPQQVDIGGKYASIVISIDKVLRDPGDSAAVARVVSLIMVTVAGDFEENARVLDFDVSQQPQQFNFMARIRNQGAAHIKPEGSITISNLFGSKVGETAFAGDNVLPGSIRKSTVTWEPNKFMFGLYKATLAVSYGQKKNTPLTEVRTFWVFPEPFTIILCLIIAVVAAYGVVLSKRKKKRS